MVILVSKEKKVKRAIVAHLERQVYQDRQVKQDTKGRKEALVTEVLKEKEAPWVITGQKDHEAKKEEMARWAHPVPKEK